MDARAPSPFSNRRPSAYEWIMLAASFLTVGWIVVGY
jgi:hypothetical protein